jgi:hypothetical protein
MPIRNLRCFGVLFVFAGAMLAQVTTSGTVSPAITVNASGGVIGGFIPAFGLQPLRGMPYSAQQITERVQTLADGTHITQTPQTTLVYRDSEGRTRTEHIFAPPPGAVVATPAPAFVEITDPVGGYRYTLDTHNHVAHRMAWAPPQFQKSGAVATSIRKSAAEAPANLAIATIQTLPAPIPPGNAAPPVINGGDGSAGSSRPHPEMKHEDLGTQTIEGVAAEGRRTTVTYPEGMLGNDRPITTVSETWTSPELKLVVLTKMSDPRTGESTTRLANLSQSEPDAALFQVPADYSVQDTPQPNAVPNVVR